MQVIFICQEDIFKLGLYRYSFENACTESEGLKLGDGLHKVFFNTKGYQGEINSEAKAILDFIEGIVSDDPFVQELAAEVEKIKNNEMWRLTYMDQYRIEQDMKREGRKEGKMEEKVAFAKNLLNLGVNLDVIAKGAGVTVQELNELMVVS